MYYNVRVKTFSDGSKQYFYCDSVKEREYKKARKDYCLDPEEKVGDSHRSLTVSLKRTRQIVYDIARSNNWDWFITLTFNPEIVNSFDYEECCDAIKKYTRHLHYDGLEWLLVPELHKSGRYHFHGLIKGYLDVVPSKIKDIYNVADYDIGFTTASIIQSHERVATYITKYLTKELAVPKGKKRYWSSRGLQRPSVTYDVIYKDELDVLLQKSSYNKIIETAYGNYVLLEVNDLR